MKKKSYWYAWESLISTKKKYCVLTSLKKAVDDRMLKIVSKINKNSYRVVKETHLDGECVTESQMDETLESTDVFRDTKLPMMILETQQMN